MKMGRMEQAWRGRPEKYAWLAQVLKAQNYAG
jgi:hypothetical protein